MNRTHVIGCKARKGKSIAAQANASLLCTIGTVYKYILDNAALSHPATVGEGGQDSEGGREGGQDGG